MDIFFFISIAIIFGFIAGKLVNRLKLPAVVGYLIAGLVFGPSLLNVYKPQLLDKLNLFTGFALSLVAFIIGSEMKLTTLRRMGAGIGIIILLESFAAFFFVAAGVYFLTGKLYLALVFGALAPASAPAGTVAVLQEYKAKGRLTNALYAVVGLDDGLAIIIFAVAAAMARLILTGEQISVIAMVKGPLYEMTGSIILGGLIGLALGYLMRKLTDRQDILASALAGILICTGIADRLHFSLILANLALGMTFANMFEVSGSKAYRAIKSLTLPVYIIFFFMAGANLHISLLPSMGLLGLVYLICRTAGLISGASLGAALSRQETVIQKYLGLGILSQAGVAIGLAVLVASDFANLGDAGKELAITTVNTIAATTIIFEIIGPVGVRIAVSKAGEMGANITEQDLIETYRIRDVMDTSVSGINIGTALSDVVKTVSNTDGLYYPVVDGDSRLIGAITLDGIRKTFATQELNSWLVALDIAEPVVATLTPELPLSEGLARAEKFDAEQMPVVVSETDNKFVGVFDSRLIRRRLSAEVLARQHKADSMHRAS